MDKKNELCKYRYKQAEETLGVAELCLNKGHYKDSINRSYYAAFYAIKALLSLDDVDFKRHKDVVAYFNQIYIATGLYDKEIGRYLSRLQKKRESSDYDDFVVTSKNEAEEQLQAARKIITAIKNKLSV